MIKIAFSNIKPILVFITILVSLSACKNSSNEVSKDIDLNVLPDIYLADPTIFFHDGIYYLYGTGGHNSDTGFMVYTSKDMKQWEGPAGASEGYALKKGEVYGDKGFWAPQVFFHEGKFYMAYTANENIAIATSDSPLGPFVQTVKVPLEAPVKQIDPFVFIDDNGKKYLYHVRLTEGNRIFVAELKDDFSGIKPETLTECIDASEPWENTANASWPVAEGPSILKRDGLYYLVYSANDFRNIDYGVGYAVSTSPLGPWEKYEGNPVLTRNDIDAVGTGHGDFIKDEQNNLFYVFHTHYSSNSVSPRKTAIIEAQFLNDGTLSLEEDTFYYAEKLLE